MDAWLALLTEMVLLSRSQGWGHDLKETEGYSYRMTDLIHRAFYSSRTATSTTALCAIIKSNSPPRTLKMAYPRKFPEGEEGSRLLCCCCCCCGCSWSPEEPVSGSDDMMGPNGRSWQSMLTTVTSVGGSTRVT